MPVIVFNHLTIPAFLLLGIFGGFTPSTSGLTFFDEFLLSLQFVSGSGLEGVNEYELMSLTSDFLTLTTL